jgi:ribosomal protein L12E/L44/L45/RPP1/RPP2
MRRLAQRGLRRLQAATAEPSAADGSSAAEEEEEEEEEEGQYDAVRSRFHLFSIFQYLSQ